ncbi:hypothetical protein Tco_0977966 [Tanacetum coccineum]|uniref:Uncharacterized protein n=1 Tax=Tanacetum coccineum TaxID=301880 RepID=A0ABQ5ELV0_9ASTR
MSSLDHPTANLEDAFSFNFPNYVPPASPDYVPASPGKTYSSASIYWNCSACSRPFRYDPYMKSGTSATDIQMHKILCSTKHTAIETVLNMTPENKEHFQSEKEEIFLLLTGIGDEIYSTVDACNTANEMWIAIERLHRAGSFLNVQDVKNQSVYRNLIGEPKVQNPLALPCGCSHHIQRYLLSEPNSRSNETYLPQDKCIIDKKGKEVAKPITPQSESVSEEDSDPEQAQRERNMQKGI